MASGTFKNQALKDELFKELKLKDGRSSFRNPTNMLQDYGYRVVKTSKGDFTLYVLNPDAPPGKPKAMYLRKFAKRPDAEKIGKQAAAYLEKKYGLTFKK